MSDAEPREPEHYFDHVYLGAAHDRNARMTMWIVALNGVAMIAEIGFGWITGSMALLADGFHMATDAGALAVAALAYRFARTHAHNARFTFGTGKVGDLAAFASAIILALAAIGIGVEAAMRLAQPQVIAYGQAIVVATIGLAVNLASAVLLMRGGGGHAHHGHDHGGHDHVGHDHGHDDSHGGDNNMRAAYVHLVADAVTSALAIVALGLAWYTGLSGLDAIAGMIGAVLIGRWSIMLLRDTAAVLLDTADEALLARVRKAAEASGATITDLHIWRIGPQAHAVIVSARGVDAEAIRVALRPIHGLEHVTVECG